MRPNLKFDFIVDRKTSRLTLRREFLAERQLVWDCHTKSELLNQWFAPKPLTTITKSMEFKEGGHWHYAMIDPNGKEYWGYTEYVKIKPIEYYTSLDTFSNDKGEINTELPKAKWRVKFIEKGERTLVETAVQYRTLADLETVIQMGMKQGMESTIEKLEELLETLSL